MLQVATEAKKMLGTDLDGTFIGDDAAMYQLLQVLAENDIRLVFSTGRHLPSVADFLAEKKIKNPDACVLMVGTEVFLNKKGRFVADHEWQRTIGTGWDREKIVETLNGYPFLTLQDAEWQTDFKISYYLHDGAAATIDLIKQRLNTEGLPAHVIYSGGRFLDFLPERAGKASAISYVAGRLGINTQNLVVAGDTGNDLDMFRAGFKGIIVGNAHPELKEFDGQNAYHAESAFSAGILEGLRYFKFID